MKSVAIILARGGSKRLPDKNIIEFHGKPMLAWSIGAAMEANCFEEIYISTDSQKIFDIAIKFGATSGELRPPRLSDDFTSSTEVMRYEASRISGKTDSICFIYGSSPMIKSKSLLSAYNILKDNVEINFSFPVTQFPHPPQRGFLISNKGQFKPIPNESYKKRTQDLEVIYHDAGQFYFGRRKSFIDKEEIFDKGSFCIEIPKHQCCDIDDAEDLMIAKSLFKNL